MCIQGFKTKLRSPVFTGGVPGLPNNAIEIGNVPASGFNNVHNLPLTLSINGARSIHNITRVQIGGSYYYYMAIPTTATSGSTVSVYFPWQNPDTVSAARTFTLP